MEELFMNVSEQVRAQTKFWVDMALIQPDLISGLNMIKTYFDSCNTEEEKDYVCFYFTSIMEQRNNENNSN